jgi:hypothetical protein
MANLNQWEKANKQSVRKNVVRQTIYNVCESKKKYGWYLKKYHGAASGVVGDSTRQNWKQCLDEFLRYVRDNFCVEGDFLMLLETLTKGKERLIVAFSGRWLVLEHLVAPLSLCQKRKPNFFILFFFKLKKCRWKKASSYWKMASGDVALHHVWPRHLAGACYILLDFPMKCV